MRSGAGICLRPAQREPAADSQRTGGKKKKVDRELLYNTAQNDYILMTMLLYQEKIKLHLGSFVTKGRNGYKTF